MQILATSTSKSAPTPSVFLTILTSKSCSRAGVVQILPASTSKSRPRLPVFNDFNFQIALVRRRGANFATSWPADPPRPPVLRSWFSQPAKPQNFGKTQHFAQFLPAKSSCLTSLLYHICAITSFCFKIFSSNSQYSRKLDSYTYTLPLATTIPQTTPTPRGGTPLPPPAWGVGGGQPCILNRHVNKNTYTAYIDRIFYIVCLLRCFPMFLHVCLS